MVPTDEDLLHRFYAGDTGALERIADRHTPLLARLAHMILVVRTGSEVQSLGEWDIAERVEGVWVQLLLTRQAGTARWPHQWMSALTWLIHLLALEMDRHLGRRGPF